MRHFTIWILLLFCVYKYGRAHYLISFDCVGAGAPEEGIRKFADLDETNCQNGVYCVNQKPFLIVCPPSLLFNPETLDCDLPSNIPSCDKDHGTFVHADEVINAQRKISFTSLKENDCAMRVSGNYPLVYGDCSQYLFCSHGKAIVKRCHWNLLFDTDTKECQPPSEARCWVANPAQDNMYLWKNNVILGKILDGAGVHIQKHNLSLNTSGPRSHTPIGKAHDKNHVKEEVRVVSSHTHNSTDGDGTVVAHEVDGYQPKNNCHYKKKLATLMFDSANDSIIITSFGYSNKGQWEEWLACSPGKYVNGLSTYRRSKTVKGVTDNVGVISISFQCQSPGDLGFPLGDKDIISFAAPGAPPSDLRFNKYYTCEEGAAGVGFQLNSEKDQEEEDDIGTANVKLLCSCGQPAVKPYWKPDYQPSLRKEGEWLSQRYCQPRQAICAINAQMHDYIDEVNLRYHDNTGLNNIKVKCCNVPNPVTTCAPVVKEIPIANCNNTNSDRAMPCEFDVIVGLAYNHSKDGRTINFYESIGFTLAYQAKTLKEKLAAMECKTDPCMYDWKSARETVWRKDEVKGSVIVIPPRWNSEIYQIVSECEFYTVRTNRLLRLDTNQKYRQLSKEYFDVL